MKLNFPFYRRVWCFCTTANYMFMVTSSLPTAWSILDGRYRLLTSDYSISEHRLITKETNMPNIEVSSSSCEHENEWKVSAEWIFITVDLAFNKSRKQSKWIPLSYLLFQGLCEMRQFLMINVSFDNWLKQLRINIYFRSVMDSARITQELQIVTKERNTKGGRVRIWYHSLWSYWQIWPLRWHRHVAPRWVRGW